MRLWAHEAYEAHLAHLAHAAVLQHTQLIQQCQCWTAPMIFKEKTAYFRRLKKNGLHRDGPTDRRTDGRTRPHIGMRGRI